MMNKAKNAQSASAIGIKNISSTGAQKLGEGQGTHLIDCVLKGKADELKEHLINGADPDYSSKSNTLAMLSALNGQMEALTLLNQHGASLNATNKHFMSGLAYAICIGNVAEAEYLRRSGADVKIKNNLGLTAHDNFKAHYMNRMEKNKAKELLRLSDPSVELFDIERLRRRHIKEDVERHSGLPLIEISYVNGNFTYFQRIPIEDSICNMALSCLNDQIDRASEDLKRGIKSSINYTWDGKQYIKLSIGNIVENDIAAIQVEIMQIAQMVSINARSGI